LRRDIQDYKTQGPVGKYSGNDALFSNEFESADERGTVEGWHIENTYPFERVLGQLFLPWGFELCLSQK
jgi:hypothetical protein